MDAKVIWKSNMSFDGSSDSGFTVPLGTGPEVGGNNDGFRPMELIAIGIAGCTAMDVVAFLQKKRRTVEALTVRVTGKRREQPPRIFEELTIDYRVRGPDLTEADIRWAVELSINKYCSVLAMLSQSARVIPRWTLEPPASS